MMCMGNKKKQYRKGLLDFLENKNKLFCFHCTICLCILYFIKSFIAVPFYILFEMSVTLDPATPPEPHQIEGLLDFLEKNTRKK